MSPVKETLEQIRAELTEEMKNGTWVPEPGDPLSECLFVRQGFRAWELEAADHSWRLRLNRADFGDSDPKAQLLVYAPNHAEAFPDLNWLAFRHSVGVNGGTNFNQAVTRLSETLSGGKSDGAKLEWARRLTYLIERSRQANAGANNGTFSTHVRPELKAPTAYIFENRVRLGRTVSLFGAGSAGKTTIADALVASACSGIEILPGWVPSGRFASLVLDWDEGQEEETIRLNAICSAYGIELTGGYHYKRQARPLHDVADEIGTYISDNGISLVVVSPMGRAQRGMGDNLTAPVDEVHEILRSFGTTNILIDHVTGENMKGGAQREFGSVRKRDNVRGSYGVDVQSEEPGTRVLVIRNTKADALTPRLPDQAVRIEYDPPWPKPDHTYDRITFHADEIVPTNERPDGPGEAPMRVLIRDLLTDERLNATEIADRLGAKRPTVERVLYRYSSSWFGRLPSGKWELLPAGRASLTH